MAVKKYHENHGGLRRGAAVGLLAFCLAVVAVADELRVDRLHLSFDAAWQRGDPRAEEESDSHILTGAAGGGALQLFVPRRAAPMKSEPERFREQLARKWRILYGDAARIAPRTLAGRDWLTCRRPGQDGRSTVFQWVTVEAEQAYSLIWFDDGRRDELPSEALALLAEVGFRAGMPEPEPVSAVAVAPRVSAAASERIAPPEQAPAQPPAAIPVPAVTPTPVANPMPVAAGEPAIPPLPAAVAAPTAEAAVVSAPVAVPLPVTAPTPPVATVTVPEPHVAASPEPAVVTAPVTAVASAPVTADGTPPGGTPQAETGGTPPRPELLQTMAVTLPVTAASDFSTVPAWRLVRTVVARPDSGVLETLAQLDAGRLPKGDVLTGHGLKVDERGLAWFLEGFRWVPRARSPDDLGPAERKSRFRLGWQVDWDAPPGILAAEGDAPLVLRFRSGGREEPAAANFGLRFQWLEICAADGPRQRAYAHLARGRHAPFERLLRLRHGACPDASEQPLPESVFVRPGLGDAGGETVEKSLALPLPRTAYLPVRAAGVRRVLVLAVRFFASETDDQAGDGLLRQAGVYYLYVPES
ncbi:MAG TPA: hypothetical protein PLW81_04665 [Thiobacillaceae bacterium]|nr:hypothetical protein [Thiobacillaceae bacterium]